MKCIKKVVFVTALSLVLASCASSKNEPVKSAENEDSYEIPALEETNSDDNDDYDSSTEISKKNIKKKSSGNFFKDLFSSNFIVMGDGSLFTTKVFGGLNQTACDFVLYPKKDTAGFGSQYMAAYYYITFDDQNRINYTGAMNRYFKDFENKKLSRDDRKSFKAYGKVNAYIRWGGIKSNTPYFAQKVPVLLGYKFVDNSPYFTITIDSVPNESVTEGINDVSDVVFSTRLNYFFTKAQCRMAIDALSKDSIENFYQQYERELYGEYQSEDEYFDDSEDEEVEDVSDEE